jgi:hypothetical protein
MSHDNRIYPEGTIAWDEAWRQRQRADTLEGERDKLLQEIDAAIDALDPEMMRYQIVELRERFIRFRATLKQ